VFRREVLRAGFPYVWWESSLEVAKADEPATLIASGGVDPVPRMDPFAVRAECDDTKVPVRWADDITTGIAADYPETGVITAQRFLTL
jgi:hypothetical protein